MFSHRSEKGNALWFILIAIFLLGMLTMLITRTSGTSEETGDAESANIKASEIVRHFSAMETAIQAMISRGCSENQISFHSDLEMNATNKAEYALTPGPSDGSCHIFETAGGGVKYKTYEDLHAGDMTFSGRAAIAGWGGGQATLIAFLEDVSLPVCIAYNRLVGMPLTDGEPPLLASNVTASPFKGLYASLESTVTVTGNTGRKAGCVEGIGAGVMPAGSYSIYYALINRGQ